MHAPLAIVAGTISIRNCKEKITLDLMANKIIKAQIWQKYKNCRSLPTTCFNIGRYWFWQNNNA
jgi:hypothetical protein